MLEKALALGMTEEEYQQVVQILGRTPSDTELAMYSVEWSEHCGYPRSRGLLKELPKKGHYSAVSGADTGGIEIEPDLYVVFKMESHNHPSQVDPHQGAATGVGGVIRDIFTCGATPIAALNSLRFGELSDSQAQDLFRGAVGGISWYGNNLGVPTVAGEVGFNHSYRGNCLVGAMGVGVVRKEDLVSGAAAGAGNSVMYFGRSTGRDGVGGCSILASTEISEDTERPTVPAGDPFAGKALIEACLEAVKTGAIVGMKDMGAAGITCTTAEMSAEGRVGMDINLDHVPLREIDADMEPFEIMMSETQERMLAVVERGREEEVIAIFEDKGLYATKLGEVTGDGILTIRSKDKIVAEMTAKSLAEAPLYTLPYEKPSYLDQVQSFDPNTLSEPTDYNAVLTQLLQAPNIASKNWAYSQFDSQAGNNTVVSPGEGDAAVLRISQSKSNKGIAATADCNSRYCYLDPELGAQIAVAESARNLVCVGAEPAALTDCLCFGNPDKPERFWQFRKALDGIISACEAFHLPVVSGNVSFYNETAESVIHPSPLIGMVGVLDDVEKHVGIGVQDDGDIIVLVGSCTNELGGSEYLATYHEKELGVPPQLDFSRELNVQRVTLAAIRQDIAKSAHDVSDGGLAVAITEMCTAGKKGAKVLLPAEIAPEGTRLDAILFGEAQSRILLTLNKNDLPALEDLARQTGISVFNLGHVGGDRLEISHDSTESPVIDSAVSALEEVHGGAIAGIMEG